MPGIFLTFAAFMKELVFPEYPDDNIECHFSLNNEKIK